MRVQQTRDYEWMELLYYHYHRNVIWLHLSAATTSDIRDARATRAPSGRNLPRSLCRIHNPALKMREYSRRFSRRLFQASDRSPPRPAARASERGLRYMARREIFSKYDVNGQNNTFSKMSKFKNTYLLVSLLPPRRSFIVWLPLSWETPRPFAVIVTMDIYMHAHGRTVRMRACVQARPQMIQAIINDDCLIHLTKCFQIHIYKCKIANKKKNGCT